MKGCAPILHATITWPCLDRGPNVEWLPLKDTNMQYITINDVMPYVVVGCVFGDGGGVTYILLGVGVHPLAQQELNHLPATLMAIVPVTLEGGMKRCFPILHATMTTSNGHVQM